MPIQTRDEDRKWVSNFFPADEWHKSPNCYILREPRPKGIEASFISLVGYSQRSGSNLGS